MTDKPPTQTTLDRRYARLYSDGSFNVASAGEDRDTAVRRISGSSDDGDTQLVEVEIRVVASLGFPKLKLIETDPAAAEVARLREALEAVQSEILLTGHLAEIVEEALS